MHPILFHVWKFPVYSYGFLTCLAFVLASLYLSRVIAKSKEKLISQGELDCLLLLIIVLGFVGSKLLYIITELRHFILYPLDIFRSLNGGFVYYGGFISVIVGMIIYSRRKKINFLKLCDFFAPGLALGHAIGRIGCFFAGCCHGKESNLPWAVMFNDKNSVAVTGVHLHPTQLYESLGNFLLFILLYFYSKKERKAGVPIAIYLIGYAVLRFVIEFFRGDDRGMQYLGLSISQIISIFLLIGGIFIFISRASSKTSVD
jgi:phosphatidylglycerol:prolipoprotein diacylglycerol transferase